MSPESLTQMAKSADNSKKQEKTQEELRAILEHKLESIESTLNEGKEEYKQALKDDIFEDKEDETEGAGEARRVALQKKLTDILDRAEKMKSKLDSKEPIPQAIPNLSTTYTHPDGKKETISLDIEAKLQDFITFYQTTNIDLPRDFEDTIRTIWENNYTDIEQAIEQNGFDDILIIPANIPLPVLAEKMKMESGYWESNNFKQGGSFIEAISSNTDKPRIILIHKAKELTDRGELSSTLNIKGQDVKLDQALTLEDYIIFQRKYFEETTKHLDETKYTWLSTKSGPRLVNSYWNPGHHELNVNAHDLESQDGHLGVRPSRCFS